MDREVFIITPNEDMFIGRVRDILDTRRQDKLELAMRDILDNLVFGDDNKDYAIFTVELR